MKRQISLVMAVILLISMISFLGSLLPVRAGVTYYVSNSGSDSNSGRTQTSPWQHIQYAVTHAVAGATIMIAAGTYAEQVVINQSLSLEGAGASTVIEPGPTTIAQVYTIDGGTWYGWNLAGIIIVENVTSGTVNISNLKVNGINVNVTGLGYPNCYPVGITYGESPGTVQNVSVVNMNTAVYESHSYGIWLNAFANTVSDTIQNCTVQGYYRNGIMTTGGALTFDINGNTVTGPGELGPIQLPNGICIADNSGGTVSYNTITGNLYNYTNPSQNPYLSIGIIGSNEREGTSIHNNVIYNNDEGIAPTSGDSIFNNQIYNNEWFGVELEEGAANNSIRFNNIVDNGYGIHLLGSGSPWYTGPGDEPGTGNIASFNNITGNTMGGVQNWDTTQTFNAENNWWGSNSGPSGVGPGTGDKVSSYVAFTPWLQSSYTSPVTYYTAAIKSAANRLVALQSPTDYGWDWNVTGLASHTSNPSSTNLYGVTALGLIDAYAETGNTAYLNAAKETAEFIEYGNASAGDFWNGIPPDYIYYWGYSFDFKFLVDFSILSGNSSYANYAKAAWAWQTSAASITSIPDLRYMDGNQSYLYNYFITGPGEGSIGYGAWQASDYGLAAWEMGDTVWAQHMASVISSNVTSITSTNMDKDLGMAWALKLLVTVNPTTYASQINTLTTDLKNDQLPDGSWADGNPDGNAQTTAYAIMALQAAGSYAGALKGANWLLNTQLVNGGWSANPDEYSEIDSECLQALASSVVQLTVTSAYDTPNPSGTTSYLVGTNITASITPVVSGPVGTQYVCTGWTGTGAVPSSGTVTTVTFNITQDSTITWNWKTQYSVTFNQVGIASDYNGTVIRVDGVNYTRTGVTFWWDASSTHRFSYHSPLSVSGGKQYVWTSTTGLSTAQKTVALIINGSGTVTGNYETQYEITFAQSGIGNNFNSTIVSIDGTNYNRTQLPTTFWWNNGSPHNFSYASPLTVNGHEIYTWSSTTGLSPLQSGPLTVSASGSVIGNYVVANAITFAQVGINASVYTGTVIVIDGTPYTAAQLPIVLFWTLDSTHTFAFESPLTVGANTEQYVWVSTSGLSSVESGSITVTTYGSIVGNYKTQYYLTLVTNPSGVNSPIGQGWYDSGTYAGISTTQDVAIVSGSSRYDFRGWTTTSMSEITNASSISTTVFMDQAKTVTANYVTQYYLTVTSAYDSPTPSSSWFDSGTSVTESITPLVQGPPGTRYICVGWTGTGSASPSGSGSSLTFTISAPSAVTWNWQVQYFLTVQTSPVGVDSPTGTGWYFAGSYAGISTTQDVAIVSGSSRYDFRGWTTTSMSEITNASSISTTVFMDQAKTVTANYVAQYQITFGQSGVGSDFNGNIISIDGTNYARTGLPAVFWWDANSVHTFSYFSPFAVGNGKQYAWNSTTVLQLVLSFQAGTLTVTSSGTVTGNYETQYQITFGETSVGTSFNGTIVSIDGTNYSRTGLPAVFWWDANSVHSYSFASPFSASSTQYHWNSTSGLSTLQSGSLTVTSSGSIVGNYIVLNEITFEKYGVGSDFTGTVVVIDGQPYTAAQLPISFNWAKGQKHTFAFESPLTVGANTEQYVWVSTSGLSSVESGSITVTTYGSIVGNYVTQYFLTIAANPAGLSSALTISPTGQIGVTGWWYKASTSVTLTATSVAHFSFSNWVIDGTSQGSGVNPIQVVMDAPHNAVGYYSLDVEVLNMSFSKTIIGRGCPMPVGVTVKNYGSATETFNVTIYLNATSYSVQQFVSLNAGSSRTLMFSLNSSECSYGYYVLWASVLLGPGETANYTCRTIKVTVAGDINGDGKVNLLDLTMITGNWQKKVTPALANVDILNVGVINLLDLTVVTGHWQDHT